MMKLWYVTSDESPDLFIRAESEEQAEAKFWEGIHDRGRFEPSLKVQELTWELFLSVAPDEFRLEEDTGF